MKLSDSRHIRGFLLDISGVLYNSAPGSTGKAIDGSVEAVKRLYNESMVRFVTNENTCNRHSLLLKLSKLGFAIKEEHVFMPVPVAKTFLIKQNLRPYLIVHKGIMAEFDGLNVNDPNCILMGDAEENFSYETLNTAFRIVHELDDPLIITLGCGKFYQRLDGPCMDVGGFAHGLQFASGARVLGIGKPSETFFMAAINDMGLGKEDASMGKSLGEAVFDRGQLEKRSEFIIAVT